MWLRGERHPGGARSTGSCWYSSDFQISAKSTMSRFPITKENRIPVCLSHWKLSHLSCACSVTSVVSDSLRPPWTVACQAPVSTGFSRHEYWSGLLCLPPGDLPKPGIDLASPVSPAWQADSLPTELLGKPKPSINGCHKYYLHVYFTMHLKTQRE